MTQRRPGYTILEMSVVLFVVALCAALGIPALRRFLPPDADISAVSASALLERTYDDALWSGQRSALSVDLAGKTLTASVGGGMYRTVVLPALVAVQAAGYGRLTGGRYVFPVDPEQADPAFALVFADRGGKERSVFFDTVVWAAEDAV